MAQPKKKNQMASVLCSEPSHDHPSLRVEIPTRAISSLSEPTSCHSLTSGHSPVPLCRHPPRGLPSWPLSLLQFCSTVTLFKTATTSSFSPSFLILSSSYPHSYSPLTFLQSSHHHLILIHLFVYVHIVDFFPLACRLCKGRDLLLTAMSSAHGSGPVNDSRNNSGTNDGVTIIKSQQRLCVCVKYLHRQHAREAGTAHRSEGVYGDCSGPSLLLDYTLGIERWIGSGLHPQRICGLERGIL